MASTDHGGTVKLWATESGGLLHDLRGHRATVHSAAFSPDGRLVASGSTDKTVKLWDAQSGALVRTLAGHESWVQSVAFSPDGGTLASGSEDGTVRLWDPGTGELLGVLAVFPDGHFLSFHPTRLGYRSSRQPGEREMAAVRFDGRLLPVYPLHQYREELLLPSGQPFDRELPVPAIRPR